MLTISRFRDRLPLDGDASLSALLAALAVLLVVTSGAGNWVGARLGVGADAQHEGIALVAFAFNALVTVLVVGRHEVVDRGHVDRAHHRQTGHPGHLHVEEREVRREHADRFDGLDAVPRHPDALDVRREAEPVLDVEAVVCVVVDDDRVDATAVPHPEDQRAMLALARYRSRPHHSTSATTAGVTRHQPSDSPATGIRKRAVSVRPLVVKTRAATRNSANSVRKAATPATSCAASG